MMKGIDGSQRSKAVITKYSEKVKENYMERGKHEVKPQSLMHMAASSDSNIKPTSLI